MLQVNFAIEDQICTTVLLNVSCLHTSGLRGQVGNSMPVIQQGQEQKVGAHMVRESFERLRAEAAPFIAEHGLPLIDCYIMNTTGAMSRRALALAVII